MMRSILSRWQVFMVIGATVALCVSCRRREEKVEVPGSEEREKPVAIEEPVQVEKLEEPEAVEKLEEPQVMEKPEKLEEPEAAVAPDPAMAAVEEQPMLAIPSGRSADLPMDALWRTPVEDVLAMADSLSEEQRSALAPMLEIRIGEAIVGDPAKALAFYEGLETAAARAAAAAPVALAYANADRAAAAAWAAQISGAAAREQAIAMMAQVWVSNDPEQGVAWLNALPADAARDAGFVAFGNGLEMLAKTDVERAAAIATSLPTGEARAAALKHVVPELLVSDSEMAIEWGRALEPGVARDEALSAIAASGAGTSFEGAMALTQEIEDEMLRESTELKVVDHWMTIDPTLAQEWIRQRSPERMGAPEMPDAPAMPEMAAPEPALDPVGPPPGTEPTTRPLTEEELMAYPEGATRDMAREAGGQMIPPDVQDVPQAPAMTEAQFMALPEGPARDRAIADGFAIPEDRGRDAAADGTAPVD